MSPERAALLHDLRKAMSDLHRMKRIKRSDPDRARFIAFEKSNIQHAREALGYKLTQAEKRMK